MTRKLIIDADPGCGDALAVAFALLDPAIDVVGLTACGGRASGAQASRHLQGVVELIDPPKWPRIGCTDAPAIHFHESSGDGTQRIAPSVDGPVDLGPLEFGVAQLAHPRDSDRMIVDLVRDEPQELTILTLGPMTNLQLAGERFPEFHALVKNIVCLGGTISVPGDVSAVAEYNMAADPEAARSVFSSAVTKTLIPLDLVRRVVMTFDRFQRLRYDAESPIGRILDGIVPYALRSSHEQVGMEGMYLPGILALAAVSRPDLFETASASIDIETRGELTRGMTVSDRRDAIKWKANCEVATQVSAQAVMDYIQAVVRHDA